jgi:hypothetical protein
LVIITYKVFGVFATDYTVQEIQVHPVSSPFNYTNEAAMKYNGKKET